jgi:predicted aminopeptidase
MIRILTILLVMPMFACSLPYVVKQGYYQMKLLAGAEPIEMALRKSDLDENSRKKLKLILDVRDYCHNKLGLVANKNYSTVNLSWSYILYNVSASEALSFNPYLWHFPIIGSVPYKGFFDISDANKEERALKEKGLDTMLRRVGGYSSLGYFEDPVWPSMLAMREESLAELVIHELTHATLYFPNQSAFNESLANFVGNKGALLYFTDKYGADSKQAHTVKRLQEEQIKEDTFFRELFEELNNVYNSQKNNSEKLKDKKDILDNYNKKFIAQGLASYYSAFDWAIVNNAYLYSFKLYNNDEKVFADLYLKAEQNFTKFFAILATLTKEKDPFLSLKKLVGEHTKEQ